MNREEHEATTAIDPSPYGSSFDDFLAEQGILKECTKHALKAVLAWQLDQPSEGGLEQE